MSSKIEHMRKKLIERLCPELLRDGKPLASHDRIPQDEIYKAINEIMRNSCE